MKNILKYIPCLLVFLQLTLLAQTPNADRVWVMSRTARVATNNIIDLANVDNATTIISYADGSGQAIQTIAHKASPNKQDLVVGFNETDALGRPLQNYLPVNAASTTGVFFGNVPTTAVSFYGDSKPFSLVKTYDASPGSIALKTIGPGAVFQTPTGIGSSQDFSVIGTGIRKYKLLANGNIDASATYTDGDVLQTIETDADGNSNITLKGSKSGRTLQVQQRAKNSSNTLTTAYVYDELGRLRHVIPPLVFAKHSSIISTSPVLSRIYTYTYDTRSRLVSMQKPDAGPEYTVYNELGQAIFSQNSRQAQANLWEWMAFDGHGRVVMQGVLTSTLTRQAIQTLFDAHLPSQLYEEPNINTGNVEGYTTRSIPASLNAYIGVNIVRYYDSFPFGFDPALSFQLYKTQKWLSAAGLQTAEKVRNLATGTWLSTAMYYDDKNRLIQTQTSNRFGVVNQSDNVYTFAGDVLETRVIYRKPSTADLTIATQYTYDHTGRKLGATHFYNGTPTPLAQYKYDAIGRLSQKNLLASPLDYIFENNAQSTGKTDIANKAISLLPGTITATNGTYLACINGPALQQIDYTYTVRGQLRGINTDANGNLNLSNGDIWGLKLDYHETAQTYNGKIAKQTWAKPISNTSTENRSYTYTYDPYDRLETADYTGQGNEDYDMPGISYDANGNIKALHRRGLIASNTYGSTDILAYTYQDTTGSNQLNAILDYGNANLAFKDNPAATDYTYYPDGALKTDLNKGITNILYNYLGLIDRVEFGPSKRIENVYDASGFKLSQKLIDGSNIDLKEYVGGLIYHNGILETIDHDEGIIRFYAAGVPRYQFFMLDHLGNTRVILEKLNAATALVQETSYGPWGDVLTGLGQTNNFNFLYQGKEFIDFSGYNLYDFGWRNADPFTGQWNAKDPVDQFQSMPGYSIMGNNPVSLTDPDGQFVPLVIAGAAVLGGASNLWSNWGKVKGWKQGLAYFGSGAVGGVVSLVGSPVAGGSTTALLNVGIDVATGNLPNFKNGYDVAKYAGGLALDGFGVAGAGQLAKSLPRLAALFSERAIVTGGGEAIKIATMEGALFYEAAEVTIQPAIKGWGGNILSQSVKQGFNKAANLNSNAAKGNFGIYEIFKDGQLYKYGKADLSRITQSSNLPTRLHQQIRQLRELYPDSKIFGEVIDDLGTISTKSAKGIESAYLKFYYKTTGKIPFGNIKSFLPK
jgi:RHS repeat-associated protein